MWALERRESPSALELVSTNEVCMRFKLMRIIIDMGLKHYLCDVNDVGTKREVSLAIRKILVTNG
jgi:hypothetical protein